MERGAGGFEVDGWGKGRSWFPRLRMGREVGGQPGTVVQSRPRGMPRGAGSALRSEVAS